MTEPHKRRWSFSLRTLFVVVAIAGVMLAAWRVCPRNVTFEETLRIKLGMSQSEVREAIGPPASTQQMSGHEVWQYWQSLLGIYSFWVEFDDNGVVESTWI
jgi:outer membrane protein assembly factor BamE (lipoprotein component of BamABCDE complex)